MIEQPKADIHVTIGALKLGRDQDILKATLGSCVGIALLWKPKGLFGLAHCLVPKSQELSFVPGAKYVDQAVSSLIKMMGLKKEDYNEVEAHIVGGSDMSGIKINANKKTIGQMNVEAANEELLKCGFKISSQDCGGKEARQVIVDCSTGLIRVIKFTRGKKDHAS